MHSKWLTYGFLTLMGAALVTLAVLQYKWLGSVSEAEKERLEESLSASSENFVAEFNRNFSEVENVFRIQISDRNVDMEELIGEAWDSWMQTSPGAGLVDSVYLIRQFGSQSPVVYRYDTDPGMLKDIVPSHAITQWISENSSAVHLSELRTNLRRHPDFGEQSFLSVPVQLFDMVRVRNSDSSKNIEVRLSIDHSDDLVLIKLDNRVIRQELIPAIARTYFSDSFDDRYQLSIVDNNAEQFVYYTSGDSAQILPEPDFTRNLDQFNLGGVLMLNRVPGLGRDAIPDSASGIEFSFNNRRGVKADTAVFQEGKWESHFYSENVSSVSLTNSNGMNISGADTVMSSAMIGGLPYTTWQLWLSFKEGSLDAFVNKTRNRNLAISFGILSILGISVLMIVVYAQRSRDLAEQQMLFVAGVSHELRTPLTVIRSAAENLNEGVVQDESRKKEYAGLMLKEGRRLSDMVDQIMEFSGIQTGKRVYNFTSFSIKDLIDDLLHEFKPVLEEENVQLEYSNVASGQTIYADYDALYLSISNLLTNAIKFRGDSNKIRLAVADLTPKNQKRVFTIIVQDYGLGVPAEEQKQVFNPFFRGRRPVEEQLKGNGIGLSLVQKVTKAHKGEIRLKSELNKGTTVVLMIPAEHE